MKTNYSTIDSILEKDNISTQFYTVGENGETVKNKGWLDDESEIKLEEEFDNWFRRLDTTLQNEYLQNNKLLREEFKKESSILKKDIGIFMIDMKSDILENILNSVRDERGRVEDVISALKYAVDDGTINEYRKGIYDSLIKRKNALEKEELYILRGNYNNQDGNYSYFSVPPVECSVPRQFYYESNGEVYEVISYKKKDQFSYTISYKKSTDGIIIEDVVDEVNLISFTHGITMGAEVGASLSYQSNTQVLERKNEYMKKRMLSEDEFTYFFNNDTTLSQSSKIGDCYLISTLNSLRQSVYFEAFIANSIKIDYAENGSIDFIHVFLPLGKKTHNKEILIPGTDIEDLGLLTGSLGYKIIEVAYLRLLKDESNSHVYKGEGTKKKLDIDVLTSGRGVDVMKKLFGDSTDAKRFIFDTSAFLRQEIDNVLNSFNSNNGVIYFSSHGEDKREKFVIDRDGERFPLVQGHAFTFIEYYTEGETGYLRLANPRNTSEQLDIKYLDFMKFFDIVDVSKINIEEIFK